MYVGIALLSIATYYSMSAQWLRQMQTQPLTIASASGAVALVVPPLLGRQLGFGDLVANFAASTLVLVWVMVAIALVRGSGIRFSVILPLALVVTWGATRLVLG